MEGCVSNCVSPASYKFNSVKGSFNLNPAYPKGKPEGLFA